MSYKKIRYVAHPVCLEWLILKFLWTTMIVRRDAKDSLTGKLPHTTKQVDRVRFVVVR
jgi:hypothetical protein